MTYRNLMVHLDNTPAAPARLDFALALARRLDACLTGFFAMADPYVQSVSSLNRHEFLARQVAGAEPAFRQRAEEAGIEADWQSVIAAADEQVNNEVVVTARHFDLVVLGQFDPANADGSIPADLIVQTVMHSGRPVVVVPFAGRFTDVGERVVIAWNGSREAARAVNDSLPLLATAREVTVLSLEAKERPRLMAEDSPAAIVRHLARHGVEAKAEHLVFDPDSIAPADRLLSHLTDAGADLLVMGTWGPGGDRHRARTSLTGPVLAHMTVPLLLST